MTYAYHDTISQLLKLNQVQYSGPTQWNISLSKQFKVVKIVFFFNPFLPTFDNLGPFVDPLSHFLSFFSLFYNFSDISHFWTLEFSHALKTFLGKISGH